MPYPKKNVLGGGVELSMNPIQRKIKLLCCPNCNSSNLVFQSSEYLKCEKCKEKYVTLSKNSAVLIPKINLSGSKENIQKFWGDIYGQWYSEFDRELNSGSLKKHLNYLEEMFLQKKHLAVTEMELDKISGLDVLEIGSGSGAHSALFHKNGADVVSVDITPERVLSTGKKLSLLNSNSGVAFVADAENLPFNNESFDIVYSNGVLHHAENTEKCIEEVCRVLKPTGKAVIMLYSRHSALYWLNLVIKGIVTGDIFRYPEHKWLGRFTEGKPKYGETRNPFTRVYSKKQLVQLLYRFEILSLRKYGFNFGQLLMIDKLKLRTFIMKQLGYKYHPGGVIVYGSPHMCESKIELFLGPYIGFCWCIVALKRTNKT